MAPQKKHKKIKYYTIAEKMMELDGEIKPMPSDGSKIVEFYEGKVVFITGATGFLGKLLMEKLLRTCQRIGKILILVRSKKGCDPNNRLDQICNNVIFNPLRKICPDFKKKIEIVRGDIAEPMLGLSQDDQRFLQENVNIIFHVAATVRFDEKLKLATEINVRATRDLIRLAKNCRNLCSYVHISTAFSNCNRTEIDERIYQSPYRAEDLIDFVQTRSDDEIQQLTAELLEQWPNTYTITKQIAEKAVEEDGRGLPICIFRPAIIIATYKEPLRGWIDNFYGPTSITIGAGTGLVHTFFAETSQTAEIVPADYVVNCMIRCSYEIGQNRQVPVYNYVSSTENRLDWNDFLTAGTFYGLANPSVKSIWCFSLIITKHKFLYLFNVYLLHYLPGILMDSFFLLKGKKPRMLEMYRKITHGCQVLEFFSTKNWQFHNSNVQDLWKNTTEIDKKLFPFSIHELDWSDFFITHTLGLRTYLMGESLETLPQARQKYKILEKIHFIVKTIFYLFLLRFVFILVLSLCSFLFN